MRRKWMCGWGRWDRIKKENVRGMEWMGLREHEWERESKWMEKEGEMEW